MIAATEIRLKQDWQYRVGNVWAIRPTTRKETESPWGGGRRPRRVRNSGNDSRFPSLISRGRKEREKEKRREKHVPRTWCSRLAWFHLQLPLGFLDSGNVHHHLVAPTFGVDGRDGGLVARVGLEAGQQEARLGKELLEDEPAPSAARRVAVHFVKVEGKVLREAAVEARLAGDEDGVARVV